MKFNAAICRMISKQNKTTLFRAFTAACILLLINSTTANKALAEGTPVTTSSTVNNMIPALTEPGSARIEEIYLMDKTKLTRSQKRELRNEVKLIRENSDNGGVYLSIGAIIIIVLLLIILL